MIVCNLFKSVYTVENLSGLQFSQLPDAPHFFAVRAMRAVEFDAERRKTRFTTLCQFCGQYESVVGARPAFLKIGSVVEEREFVRTDLEFGSGDEKHPLLICGKTAAEAISDAELKGLDVKPIE